MANELTDQMKQRISSAQVRKAFAAEVFYKATCHAGEKYKENIQAMEYELECIRKELALDVFNKASIKQWNGELFVPITPSHPLYGKTGTIDYLFTMSGCPIVEHWGSITIVDHCSVPIPLVDTQCYQTVPGTHSFLHVYVQGSMKKTWSDEKIGAVGQLVEGALARFACFKSRSCSPSGNSHPDVHYQE